MIPTGIEDLMALSSQISREAWEVAVKQVYVGVAQNIIIFGGLLFTFYLTKPKVDKWVNEVITVEGKFVFYSLALVILGACGIATAESVIQLLNPEWQAFSNVVKVMKAVSK